MAITPISELNDRARDVFRLVVENYLGNGMPVASRTIARLATLNLSPASIRNVMQDLEELGLLAAPHTSAGRLPTETGLRLFVDGMMQAAEPSAEERRAIEARVGESGPIEDALSAATLALSGLSACAGIVMVPKREPILRQFSFVGLGDGQALAILVAQDGSVENRVVQLPLGITPSMLTEAANYMSDRLGGLTLRQAQALMAQELDSDRRMLDGAARELIDRGLAIWSADSENRPVLIVRGQANLIDETASADLERVRQLLDELEGKQEISRLLESALAGTATKIFIGSENKLFSLSGSSVIAAPYRAGDGRVVGVVGVIGPTRLNYARVIPMVDFTAQTLSRLMR
ncbi:MAG: heat-inducible transcriptional repressor HrcA [Pseudomonadota bacterium]|jgi:heat-inducible transcriptional repressor|uniref:heat-inducible transcriptional repressor HrcA n=1 Tax=unclassified Sphingobium TaxID=2611147 RepID=UPI001E5E9737|nr:MULTISPECIES: heat-inducible transcriptional repressor HrcA [unclassified Sphingobium]GLI96616.1 heat-inducible transcription repressor HrcA [Sphingobium sp. BS19]CAH0353098.1 Heat-inducible transcription repressor HrcA [Sphingobium sp. CECT 9361]|tara:strand:+ start:1732 stop:2775 length:1044 start_codon:yes stop_codon:yes gene_type:complete